MLPPKKQRQHAPDPNERPGNSSVSHILPAADVGKQSRIGDNHANMSAPQIQKEPASESAREPWWRHVRDAIRGVHHDYTEGPIGRSLLLLAVPMVLETLMESLFAVVDVFFVAKLGADAVATVGITESMLYILYSIALGLGIGATAMVARRIGERDAEGAARAAVQAIWLGVIVAAVIGITGVTMAPVFLRGLGAPPPVVELGTTYTRIMLGGN